MSDYQVISNRRNFNQSRLCTCVVSDEEWADNPDSGIPALIEQYRTENIGFRDLDDGWVPRESKKARRTEPRLLKRTEGGKTCSNCFRLLPWERFRKNIRTPDGYTYYCRECKSKKDREYRDRIKNR